MVRTLLSWVLLQLLFIFLPGVLAFPAHCHTHPVSIFTFACFARDSLAAFSPHATVRGGQQAALNSCGGAPTPTLTSAPSPSPRRGTGRLPLPLPNPPRAAPLHMGCRTA
ncbi:hypothetical protein B0H11DRAFT_2138373 [Mycena galericulata]|nr:hypothetical protein B0H11DRAFT_2138373 [Mycena galericulata]